MTKFVEENTGGTVPRWCVVDKKTNVIVCWTYTRARARRLAEVLKTYKVKAVK